MTHDLDQLERRALRAYYDTYGRPATDIERLFVQRGISAMRFAVADAQRKQEEANVPAHPKPR